MKKYLWMALTAMVLFGCNKAKVDNTKQAGGGAALCNGNRQLL